MKTEFSYFQYDNSDRSFTVVFSLRPIPWNILYDKGPGTWKTKMLLIRGWRKKELAKKRGERNTIVSIGSRKDI